MRGQIVNFVGGAVHRQRVSIAGVLAAACACTGAAALAPAASAACPSLAGVKSYGGTASMSYVSGTVIGPTGNPFQMTISVDHHASNMQIAGLTPPEGGDSFGGPTTTGGTVTIEDNYSDNEGSTSHQTANGPTESDPNGTAININTSNCTYQVTYGFQVTTSTQASGTGPDQPGEGDDVATPYMPIPANLVLQGSTSVAPVFGGNCEVGCYDLSGDPDWGGDLSDAVSSDNLPGSATVSWHLNPTGSPAPSPGPSHHSCVVPHVKGLALGKAKAAITKADCKVGNVSRKKSATVPNGKVISSRPAAGTRHPAGTKVALVVSKG